MYRKYWRLNQKPFEIGWEPRFYYPAESHQTMLNKMRYALENRGGSALLCGQEGVGKSMLLSKLMSIESRRKIKESLPFPRLFPFVIFWMPPMNVAESVWFLTQKLAAILRQEKRQEKDDKGALLLPDRFAETSLQDIMEPLSFEPRSISEKKASERELSCSLNNRSWGNDGTEASLAVESNQKMEPRKKADRVGGRFELAQAFLFLEEFLMANAEKNGQTVLVIENAQKIRDPNVFALWKSLLKLQHRGRPVVSILFMATASFEELAEINEPFFDFVSSFTESQAFLKPLDADECQRYIAYRLNVAGAQDSIFTNRALNAIFHLSRGVPRLINRLCDLALLIGCAEQMTQLDESVIDALTEELMIAPASSIVYPEAG